MKAFMEEYGVILVAALVILVLVAAANGIGDKIAQGIKDTVDAFTTKMEAVIDQIDAADIVGGAASGSGSTNP